MAERRTDSEPWTNAGYIFSEADVAHLHDLYDGEIHFADAQVGRVLAALERAGRVEDAIVVLTSDHGEWLGEQGWWDHCMTLNDVEILVPFLMRVRGGPLLGEARVSAPISTLDFVPTVAGLVGAELPDGSYHGVDLQRLAPDRIVLALWGQLASARDRDWQLFDNRGKRMPRALTPNLAGGAAGARNRRAAMSRLEAELDAAGELRGRVADQWVSTIRELQAIGYVE